MAESIHDFVTLEVSSINHVVYGNFWETIETHLTLLHVPQSKSFFRIGEIYVIDSNFAHNLLCARFEKKPVTHAVLIKKIHIFEPFLDSPLVEDSILVQLL